MRLRALLLIATLSSSGCSMLIMGGSHHPRGKSVCDSGPIPPTVDLVLAAGTLAVVATRDANPGFYAVPAVFFISGVVGGINAARCAAKHADLSPYPSAVPSSDTVDPDPDARPATPEDMGTSPQTRTPNLTLDPAYNVGPGKTPPTTTTPPVTTPKQTDERISCRDAPSSCPEGQTCAIAGDDAGFCVPANR